MSEDSRLKRRIIQDLRNQIMRPYSDGNFGWQSGKKLYWGNELKKHSISDAYVDELKEDVRRTCLGAGIKFIDGESGFLGKLFG